jgi:ABC-2 type transport system permease protein
VLLTAKLILSMRNIWIIAKREFMSFFDSLVGYILLVLFLGISGFGTWLFGNDVFFMEQASLQWFFNFVAPWALILFVPALTMRTIAEERKAGTFEVLLTHSVSDWQVVAGKYLASLLLLLLALAGTFPYYLTVAWLGPVDHGAVWGGYVGLTLLSSAFLGIGIFCSSITSNQIVAFLLALVANVALYLFLDVVANSLPGDSGAILSFLSLSTHYESIGRGVVDSRDVLYFISITLLGLILAEMQLVKRNVVE